MIHACSAETRYDHNTIVQIPDTQIKQVQFGHGIIQKTQKIGNHAGMDLDIQLIARKPIIIVVLGLDHGLLQKQKGHIKFSDLQSKYWIRKYAANWYLSAIKLDVKSYHIHQCGALISNQN